MSMKSISTYAYACFVCLELIALIILDRRSWMYGFVSPGTETAVFNQ